MIAIQLAGGFLDVYSQDIEFQWKTVRFSESIADAFSNDFTLPKTQNNLTLLQCTGLLDSQSQPLGVQITPAVMLLGGKTLDIYIQVVSVDDETVTICLFEKRIPEELLNAKIGDILRDTDDDIFVWNVNTQSAYPNWFKKYQYSLTNGINPNYAQLHPSTDINNVIQRVNQLCGINIPSSPSQHYVIATKKTVSPHNRIQVVEGHWTSDSGNFAVLSGGQHVVNDCEFSYSPDQTTITFNRDCKISGRVYYSWKKKSTVTNSFYMYICRYRPSTPTYAPSYTLNSSTYASDADYGVFSTTIKAGDTIRIQCNDTNKYDMLNFVLVFEYSDYAIVDEDYGTELKYVSRAPRLNVWTDNGMIKFGNNGWQSVGSSNGCYTYIYFDGTQYGYYHHQTGHPNTLYPAYINLEWCSIAYFQYWCNLNEITVKDLMWGFCWAEGKKLVNSYEQNMNMMVKVIKYVDADESVVVDGIVKNTVISSDTVGCRNYILQNGQDTDTAAPISEIENQWLEKEKVLHKSPFTYSIPKYGQWYVIDQYSDFEYDSDSGEYKAKFNDVEGFAVANTGSVTSMLYKFELDTMGFERITQSVEVEIETYTDVKDCDFVYLQGRKYAVIEGSTNMETGFSTIRTLLVPFTEDDFVPDHPSPQPAENQYEDDHEQTYHEDPTDSFDPSDEHPDYEPWEDYDPDWDDFDNGY